MGGSGSGNYSGRPTTVACYPLDVRRMARAGVLRSGYCYTWEWTRNGEPTGSITFRTERHRLILMYRHSGDGEAERTDRQCPVNLTRTRCSLGGERVWFTCPAIGCGRRVAILYYRGGIFACRSCHRLVYASTRENRRDRARRRAERLRIRLGWEPGSDGEEGIKPRWMRRRTFERLVSQYHAFVELSDSEALAQVLAMCERSD